MKGSDKIFFDTSPFIYLLEDHPKYGLIIRNYIVKESILLESSFFTSSITFAEFFAKPKKEGDQLLIEKFKNKIKELHFTVFSISPEISEFSCDLRTKYPNLKILDAIQLATAILFGCNKFVTNNFVLKKVNEIEIILVENIQAK